MADVMAHIDGTVDLLEHSMGGKAAPPCVKAGGDIAGAQGVLTWRAVIPLIADQHGRG